MNSLAGGFSPAGVLEVDSDEVVVLGPVHHEEFTLSIHYSRIHSDQI